MKIRLWQDTKAGQCLVFVGDYGQIVNSSWVGTVNRSIPWVDAVALESGKNGEYIRVAQKHGMVYELKIKHKRANDDDQPSLLYLGRDGFLKLSPEGEYAVIVGRLIDKARFIFDPQMPKRRGKRD